jgi:hypothetical protein
MNLLFSERWFKSYSEYFNKTANASYIVKSMLDHEKLEQFYAYDKLLEKSNVNDSKFIINEHNIWI